MGKSYVLLNLIKKQDDDDYSIIDKIYLYEVDPNVAKKKNIPLKSVGKIILKIWKIEMPYLKIFPL